MDFAGSNAQEARESIIAQNQPHYKPEWYEYAVSRKDFASTGDL
jgi:hypothetical protein